VIDQDLTIEPPPSLEAILAHPERIGRVDFTHRLVAAPPPAPDPEVRAETDAEADADAAPDRDLTGETDTGRDVHDATGTEASVTTTGGADVETTTATEEPAHPDPEAPASAQAALVADPPAQQAQVEQADEDDFLVAPALVDPPASHAGEEASTQVAALLSLVPAEDMQTVTEDVSEVVEGVLARIREVQSATLAHLEAIEVEAALRCEMLTAQAELDAELIRLHARREAHAILAAARARSGLPATSSDDVRRLDHLAAAASRFGESLEELGPRAGSSDHPFLP
jgi:hypothetical protein